MTEVYYDAQGLEKYALAHASETSEEKTRLDSMHEALTACFGGKLTLAPLESNPPKTILEMGAGSGAWAADAAAAFPNAEILAVDLAQIPRKLPANVTCLTADLTKPFNFTPNQFDLVHARLLFVNLPNHEDVLERTLRLVKPGGMLIIEDLLSTVYGDETVDELPPALTKWLAGWEEAMKLRGVDIRAATKYESFLKQSGMFTEVHADKLDVFVSGQTNDPALKQLGTVLRRTITLICVHAARNPSDAVLTESMAQAALPVMNDLSSGLKTDFYILWARKRL